MASGTKHLEATNPLTAAYRECGRIARGHYENFPVGSLVTPRSIRRHVHAVYAFARRADDFADEGDLHPDDRLGRLDDWQRRLDRCTAEPADHPVFMALADTIVRFRIPVDLFTDLIRAFRMDVTKNRYESFDELLDYCRLSANPIGRILLLIFGASSDQTVPFSDSLCSALQLTNFWQDLSVDRRKGRIYVPLEDLERFGYTAEDLLAGSWSDSLRHLMQFQVERTREMFGHASPLPRLIGGRPGLELGLTWHGGTRILRRIELMDYRVLDARPRLSAGDILAILSGTLFTRQK